MADDWYRFRRWESPPVEIIHPLQAGENNHEQVPAIAEFIRPLR
ncbi:MAG: hypothetical protein ACM3U2_22365 [Deltaproteobacteria bacterium]